MASTAPRLTTPELQAYERQFEAIAAEAQSLAAGLTDAQFNWRPAPNSWSVAECLGHLNITTEGALKVIDKLVAELRSKGLRSQGPFRHGWQGRLFIWMTEPPYRLKVPTFKHMVPPPDRPVREVLPVFLGLQSALLERLARADGLDLTAVHARNPAKVKLDLGQWFGFVAAHERRHLWQARNVRTNPRFPGT